MKKTYSKPNIMFESFELTVSIAAGCEHVATHGDFNQCSYTDEETEWTIFATNCGYTDGEVDENGVCYHVPGDGYSVFTS